MVKRKPEGSLNKHEQRIVKALLAQSRRNQDIQDLLNRGRSATINSARITEVKQDDSITPASQDEISLFELVKSSYDCRTGLNSITDERLVRSREAMILAVHIFNTPNVLFKTEVFSVLSIIAWTYLFHEYLERRGVIVVNEQGQSLLLSQMIKRDDIPISRGIRNNLESMIDIRNTVEHRLLGTCDDHYYSLYQACCLNFDKTLVEFFGHEVSLSSDLGLAIQFAKLTSGQIKTVQEYPVPEHISSLDARLDGRLSEEDKADLEYQFRVVYTLDSATRKTAHFAFVRPESSEGKEIHNVLVKHESADKKYPFKPRQVVCEVSRLSGQKFTGNNHTNAMYKYQARPRWGVSQPENTDIRYCLYHSTHKDYTYSQEWVDFLVAKITDAEEFAAIRSFKISR